MQEEVKNFAGRRILRRRVVGGGWLRRRADGWFFRARSSVAPGAQSSARIAALWCWQSRVTASPLRSLVPAPRCNWDVALRRRSEEHTSELQSIMRISYAVFCLKKKKTYNPRSITSITLTLR